jgi:hypothetical protein
MAKGAKRQKVKNALSPVRNLVSPGSSHSPSASPSFSSSATSPDENDSDSELLDDLMAELDARNGSSEAQAEAGVIAREMQMNEKVNESHSSLNPLAWRKSSKSRHQARQVRETFRNPLRVLLMRCFRNGELQSLRTNWHPEI